MHARLSGDAVAVPRALRRQLAASQVRKRTQAPDSTNPRSAQVTHPPRSAEAGLCLIRTAREVIADIALAHSDVSGPCAFADTRARRPLLRLRRTPHRATLPGSTSM